MRQHLVARPDTAVRRHRGASFGRAPRLAALLFFLLALPAPAALAQSASAPAVRVAPALGVAEQVAFDLRTVQTYLMVAALRCDKHDEYNRFMLKFRGDLQNAWQTMEVFFRRNFGQEGPRQMDTYVTALANQHSQDGQAQAGAFCANMEPMWREVHAQTTVIGLASLTSRYRLNHPMAEVFAAAPNARTPARHAQR